MIGEDSDKVKGFPC